MSGTVDPNRDPAIQYETVRACPCGGTAHDGPIWGWGVCADCGTWINTRRPTAASLGVVYGESYWSITQEMAGIPPLEQRFENDMLDRVPAYLGALVPHLKTSSRLCEVGCGNARLLHELKKLGHDVVGTELLQPVIDRVRKLSDVRVLRGGIEVLDRGEHDAAVSIDVVEHVHEPLAFLRAHADLLKPGGLLLLHTPTHERPLDPYNYTVGLLWKLYHLHLFSRALLERLVNDAGFDVASNQTRVHGWPVYVLRKRR